MRVLSAVATSTRAPSARHAALVARTELRRTWRNLTSTKRGVLLLVGAGLILPLYGLGLGAGAYFFGQVLVAGTFDVGRTVVGGTLTGVAALVVAAVLQRAIKQTGEPDGADGLLTTVPYQDVLAGLLLAEWVRVAAVVAVPVTGIAVGFAVGTGSAAAGVALLALVAAMATVGLEVGYALGLVARYVAGRFEFVARHRAAIGVSLSVGIPVAYVSLTAVPAAQLALFRFVAATPVGWFADVVYVAVPGVAARPLPAGGAVAVLLVAIPALATVTGALAARVWYMDRVEPSHEFDPRSTSLSDTLLAGTLSRGTRVVAQKSWRRARRAPFTVQFAVFPFFLLVFHLQTAIVERTVPPSMPLLVALASATAGGAAFSLNPLGGEGDVLPMTLTGTVSGRQFVTGLAVAGALPGAVLALGLSVPLGVAAGLSPLAIGAVALTGLLVALGAPAVASGVGVVFPRFETSAVRDSEVVVPSTWAFAGYATLLGVALLPVLLTQFPALASFLAGVVPMTRVALTAGGLVATGLLLLAVGGLSAGFAARRVGQYRLD